MLKYRTEGMVWVEPFVGGANMIDKVEGKRIGADLNKYLIDFWNALKEGWVPPEYITKEEHKKIIRDKENYKSEFVGWVITACTYSGSGRSYSGKSKTKTGIIRDYQSRSYKKCVNPN